MAVSNIFQNIFSSFFGGTSNDAIKKKMLKNIAKNLSKTKYHFYKAGSHEIDPSFAKFFYEIYKALSPLQLMFANTNPNALKRVTIDLALSENQKKAMESFSEESITKAASASSLEQVAAQVREQLDAFNKEFNGEKITKTDALYTKLTILKNFCQYDFYFLLKKFDSSFKERNFSSVPHFQTINGSYIIEDIKNFTAVAWAIPFDADWEDVFKLLKTIKGTEPVTLNVWKKVLARLKNIRDHRVFEMMIQLITENPGYKDVAKAEDLHIMDEYISQTRKAAEEILDRMQAEQTANKVGGLLEQIFGTANIEPLKYYNESISELYERKGLSGFAYSAPLSYLRQFLLDFVKKEVRELSDILMVRGEWASQQLAQPMSESSHQLLEISAAISVLDDKVAENGEYGMKLKTLMPRVERDKEARNICEMLINDVNNEAAKMLLTARQSMVVYAKNLKMVLEDFVKQPHSELIMNWKELDHFAEGKLKQMCIDVYKAIFSFVSLIQNFQVAITEPR